MARRNWSREELIIAFNLYCKTPFGRIHIRNPAIIELAKAIGRTPSAVSWKLANFARLDPVLRKRNIAGASHGAQAEVEIWKEFSTDWEKLAFESERLIAEVARNLSQFGRAEIFPEGKTRETMVRTRVNQGFFRAAVLASYEARCCITGLQISELLTASHIVPWSVDIKNRTNPANGLCLNAIHDRAFDCGLLTVTPDFKVKVSPRIQAQSKDSAAKEFLHKFHGYPIRLPRHFLPSPEFLRYHNEVIFLNS